MNTLLVDTHVLHWWSAEPDRLSVSATEALESADELAVAAITWYELAWLARHGRIRVSRPIGAWLGLLARSVRTAPLTPAIAASAVGTAANIPQQPSRPGHLRHGRRARLATRHQGRPAQTPPRLALGPDNLVNGADPDTRVGAQNVSDRASSAASSSVHPGATSNDDNHDSLA